MHVIPESWLVKEFNAKGKVWVTKSMKSMDKPVAKVADLSVYGHDTHFHFGTRRGVYDSLLSGAGALPRKTCQDPNGVTYPGFKENFINPESDVLFQ
jgi:hypothetical protein